MAVLTAGGVLAAVRARHPAFHPTRLGDPVLLQALGSAWQELVQSGAAVHPEALAVTVAFPGVPYASTGGAELPDALALVGATVYFRPGAYETSRPVRILPYARRFGPAEPFSAYQLGPALVAMGDPDDWPDLHPAAPFAVSYVPVPATPTTLAAPLDGLPLDARPALVARTALAAALYVAALDPGDGPAAPDPGAFAAEAERTEAAWLAALAARRALAPFVVREG